MSKGKKRMTHNEKVETLNRIIRLWADVHKISYQRSFEKLMAEKPYLFNIVYGGKNNG